MGPSAPELSSPMPTASEDARAVGTAWTIAAVGCIACALSLAAPLLHGLPMHPGPQIVHACVAAAYVGAGVVSIARRPGNVVGILMSAVGFLWLVPDLGWIRSAATFTLATTYPQAYQAVLAHLALAFPSGHLANRFQRWWIGYVYVFTVVSNYVVEAFDDPRADGCADCPRNLFLLHGSQLTQDRASTVVTATSIATVLVTGLIIGHHWWQATRAGQYVMAPVLWVLGPAVTYIVLDQAADLVSLSGAAQRFIRDYLPLTLLVLPVGYLISLLRTRLAYAHVGTFATELAGPVAPGRVREVLAAMLHDPDLKLHYWSPSAGAYVDLEGNRTPGEPAPGRSLSRLDGDSGPLAVLEVDDSVLAEPGLMNAAASMARLALENERLQAEVRSQLVQLRSASTRLVEAGQQARQRLERDLHDGAQQQLLALSMALGQARDRLGADADPQVRAFFEHANHDLQQAITELRELARGIHPVLLTQGGLRPALQALAERAALPLVASAPSARFPESVESTAYFVVSEAVTNATRHSRARRVVVEVTSEEGELRVEIADDGVGGAVSTATGTGMQGMLDRVTALGGRMHVDSPVGGGTRIKAWLPCA
jgi:signal transduction histidine kinase